MKIIRTIRDMQTFSRRLKAEKESIGFVPTMGALHDGHLSLVKKSMEDNDITIVSIFVNPTQFGPEEDFDQYPRDLEGDIKKLSSYDLDCIFLPDNQDIYPDGFSTSINVGVAGDILCGASRPGHFNGVATVVEKLFNIVMPDRAYFGQKDFQQTVVIRNMVRELNLNIDIVVCPIIRENDGLALSSRNVYLSSEERNSALIIYKALQHAEDIILSEGMEDADSVKTEIEKLIKSEPLAKIEYIEIVNPRDLKSLTVINEPATICIAVMQQSVLLS
jgi:pantoate--beta-alanine ligase